MRVGLAKSGIMRVFERQEVFDDPSKGYFYNDLQKKASTALDQKNMDRGPFEQALRELITEGQLKEQQVTTPRRRIAFLLNPVPPDFMLNLARDFEKFLRETQFADYPESMPVHVPRKPSNLTDYLVRQGVSQEQAEALETRVRELRYTQTGKWKQLRQATLEANITACLDHWLKGTPIDKNQIVAKIEGTLQHGKPPEPSMIVTSRS